MNLVFLTYSQGGHVISVNLSKSPLQSGTPPLDDISEGWVLSSHVLLGPDSRNEVCSCFTCLPGLILGLNNSLEELAEPEKDFDLPTSR